MKGARPGDQILLRYALRLANGLVIASNFEDAEPDCLRLGDGSLAPALEHWLIGLAAGERRRVLLTPEQAFGRPDPCLIHSLPLAQLPVEPALRAGTLMEFALGDGQTLPGHVLEVREKDARVDFNHPLAGCTLEFEAEIVRILSAS